MALEVPVEEEEEEEVVVVVVTGMVEERCQMPRKN
jgi:hypothetical protein